MTTATEIVVQRLPDLRNVEASLELPGASIRPCGLDLAAADADFDTWASWGHSIGFLAGWSRWAIGDWIVWGEKAFGEAEASQAIEGHPSERYDVANRITGLAVQTLMNYASICSRIPLERRRAELEFSVHEPVRGLDPDEQVFWLEQAVVNAWTRDELRDAIRDAKAPPKDDEGEGDAEPEILDPLPSTPERLREAVRVCFDEATPTSDGSYVLVPSESWRRLVELLGEE